MLPDIVAENRKRSLGNRIILIRGANDLDVTSRLADKPCPTTAELFHSGIVKFSLKIFEASERLFDNFCNFAGRLAATFRLHDFPKHSVINVSAAIIADSPANILRDRI